MSTLQRLKNIFGFKQIKNMNQFTIYKNILIAFICFFILNSCGNSSYFKNEQNEVTFDIMGKWSNLEQGVSSNEVLSLLGKQNETQYGSINTTYKYKYGKAPRQMNEGRVMINKENKVVSFSSPSPAVPRLLITELGTKWDKIKIGLPKREVKSILGNPSKLNLKDGIVSFEYLYRRKKGISVSIGRISFDENQKIERFKSPTIPN